MSGSGVVGSVTLIGIVDIGGLLSHSRDDERRGHWCEASCWQQGVDSRRVDQPCRARVQSALTLAEALAQWWLRRAALAPAPSPLHCRRCRRSRQRPTRTACMRNDRRTKHEARHWGCSRDRHSPCRHSVHTPECAHPRSRPRPIAEVVERACADPEHQARGGALDDPFHWDRHTAPRQPVRRDQPAHALRERIAHKPFNVTDERAAERDFGTHELLITCCCRCTHGATRSALVGC